MNVSGIWALPPLAFEFWRVKVRIIWYLQHFAGFGGTRRKEAESRNALVRSVIPWNPLGSAKREPFASLSGKILWVLNGTLHFRPGIKTKKVM